MPDSEDKPVVNGLVALVAVAVVVGLLAGFAALIGAKVMGVGEGGAGSDDAAGGASLYLPEPSKTSAEEGPLVTLPGGETSNSESDDKSTDEKKKKKKKDKPAITLSPGASQISPGEDLYLSGIYPDGEGAVLDIQIRLPDHPWADFPVDVNVSGSTFATNVNTSQVTSGKVQWRVVDRSRNLKSNPITVTYG